MSIEDMIVTKPRVLASLLLSGALVAVVAVHRRGREPQITDHLARGAAAWSRSCPVSSSDGLCRAPRPAPSARMALPTRCGPDSIAHGTVARSPHDVAEALAELTTAIALYEQSGGRRSDYVAAKLGVVDVDLDTFLAISFPTDLDFGPSDPQVVARSKQRFAAWLASKQQAADALIARYQSIAALGDPTGAVAAATRVGQVRQEQFEALLAAPIPESLRTGEAAEETVDAYCDALTAAAEPYEQQAIDAYASCTQLASFDGLVDSDLARLKGIAAWSHTCSAELGKARPDRFPVVTEMLATTDSDAWELVRLSIQLGNYDKASALLAAQPASYDRENMLGVVLRGQVRLVDAEAAYRRAIALVPERPEAYYNLGTLYADHLATRVPDLAQSANAYRTAIGLFEQSAARASGTMRRDVDEQLAFTRKVVAQVDAFQRAR